MNSISKCPQVCVLKNTLLLVCQIHKCYFYTNVIFKCNTVHKKGSRNMEAPVKGDLLLHINGLF